jgi:serine/threonine protein kinase
MALGDAWVLQTQLLITPDPDYPGAGDVLNTTRFGTLIHAISYDDDTPQHYAARIPLDAGRDIKYYQNELDILMSLRPHPAICGFRGFCLVKEHPCIVMEYLENGTFRNIYSGSAQPRPEWTPTVRAKCLFGLACALIHLHGHGSFHRHVTPSCVMFDRKWEC